MEPCSQLFCMLPTTPCTHLFHSSTEEANGTGVLSNFVEVDNSAEDNEGQWKQAQNISDPFFCGPPRMLSKNWSSTLCDKIS